MNKSKLGILIIAIFLLLTFGYLLNQKITQVPVQVETDESTNSLVGGQKDEHGCLIAAGYSWCEAKKECLRLWEETCSVDQQTSPDTITYSNSVNKFKISLPKTWEGYIASTGVTTSNKSISFSFKDGHQPFAMFSILIYTQKQWDAVPNKSSVKVLRQDKNGTLACDGCCGLTTDYLGGGQFDAFQIARCKEGSEIVKSFVTVN